MSEPASAQSGRSLPRWQVQLIRALGITFWPVWLRKPILGYWIPRRSGIDFAFTTRLCGIPFRGNTLDFIDWVVLVKGTYERGMQHLLADLCQRLDLSKAVFVDVGANVGVHTLFMSRRCKRVIAFEPQQTVADRIEAALTAGGLSNCTLHRIGLSDTQGTALFSGDASGVSGIAATLPQTEFHAHLRQQEAVAIPIERGDRFFTNPDEPVGVVKIDVEGHEAEVLGGLQQTLQRDQPVVFVETFETDEQSPRHVARKFPAGYEFYLFEPGVKRPRLALWDRRTAGDLVALPPAHHEWARKHS